MLRDNSIVKCYFSLVEHLRTILCSQYNYLYVTFYPRYFDFVILVLPFVSLSFFFFFVLFFFFIWNVVIFSCKWLCCVDYSSLSLCSKTMPFYYALMENWQYRIYHHDHACILILEPSWSFGPHSYTGLTAWHSIHDQSLLCGQSMSYSSFSCG